MHLVELDAEDGLHYAVQVERFDGRPRLHSVTITAPRPDVDIATVRAVPMAAIASRALALAEDDGGKPSPEAIAQAYRDALGARQARLSGQPRVSIRRELAARFGVSPFTIDHWLKRLRATTPGLLPEPFTGRGFAAAEQEEPRG